MNRLEELYQKFEILDEQIDYCNETATQIDHLRGYYPRGSLNDEFLLILFYIFEDHIEDLGQEWQDTIEEIMAIRRTFKRKRL